MDRQGRSANQGFGREECGGASRSVFVHIFLEADALCAIHTSQVGWCVCVCLFSSQDCISVSKFYITDWTDRGGQSALGKETMLFFSSLFV